MGALRDQTVLNIRDWGGRRKQEAVETVRLGRLGGSLTPIPNRHARLAGEEASRNVAIFGIVRLTLGCIESGNVDA